MIDLKEFLKAGVHFGHKSARWAPKMRHFIWGSKNKIHLIDVSKTAFLLERTGKFLKNLASEGKSFLWIGTKKPAQKIIGKISSDLKMPCVINRWIGGSLTNFDQVRKAIKKLLYLQDVVTKTTTHYTKKEISDIQKEIGRLEKKIGGIVDIDFPPAAIIVVDAKKEASAIREAINAKIPVIAMVDTNTDPSNINFVIPANDDSPRSIELIMNYLAQCAMEGQKEYQAKIQVEREKKAKTTKETKKAPVKVEKSNERITTAEKKEKETKEVKKTTTKTTVEKKPTVKKTIATKKTTPKGKVTNKKTATKK
jgi:small subunit ribosomal protein S2